MVRMAVDGSLRSVVLLTADAERRNSQMGFLVRIEEAKARSTRRQLGHYQTYEVAPGSPEGVVALPCC